MYPDVTGGEALGIGHQAWAVKAGRAVEAVGELRTPQDSALRTSFAPAP